MNVVDGRFIEAVMRDQRFAERVGTIVVELGNARRQDLADAYLGGADVAIEPVFHDLVGGRPDGVREPIYPEFFATVRAVNATLPAARQISAIARRW